MRSSLATAAALAVACAAAPGHAEVVERVAAVVDRQVVFLSEVRLVAALRGLEPAAAREVLIDELLMFHEAARLRGGAVDALQLAAAVDDLAARMPIGEPVDRDALARIARRQLAILNYLDFRFVPLVGASDEEVESERERLGEGASAEVVRAEIGRRRMDERVEEWIADLRSAAVIRLNELSAPR